MSAAEALRAARAAGVRVSAAGEDLVLEAEREPPGNVLASLAQHKAAVLALLQQAALGRRGGRVVALERFPIRRHRSLRRRSSCGIQRA